MTAYDDALDTEARWMTEIKRAFPSQRAGDVRYTALAHGEPGTALRRAYDDFKAAQEAWKAEMATFGMCYATELTTAGEQTVIPGCEKNASPRTV